MGPRRLTTGLLLPTVIAVLVAIFSTLQYRWLGQVSGADREQMRRAINERAQAFAEEFDREVVTAAAPLAADGGIHANDAGAAMAERLERWRTASRFPALVRNIYVVDGVTGDQRRRSTGSMRNRGGSMRDRGRPPSRRCADA